MNQSISGTAAGVPFVAYPPAQTDGPAPLVLTWHMMDAPRSPAAFAAALPMTGVPAWRVHLGLPVIRDGGVEAVNQRATTDAVLSYVDPIVTQAITEAPAVLAELRDRLPVDTGRVGIVGGSLGGMIALAVLARQDIPVAAAAVVNPAVRLRSIVGLIEGSLGRPYSWNPEATAAADRLDFVARAAGIAAQAPALLVVSGERDEPPLPADAAELVDAVRRHHAQPDRVRLTTIADLAHPLADEPGLEPAPQLPTAKAVDEAITAWLRMHLR
jgi:dienelactone hydrolase